VTFGIGHFLRRADLVGVEVVGLARLLGQAGIRVEARQGSVAVGFVDVGAVALCLLFLQQAQALPEECRFLGLAVLRDLFTYAAPEGVVVVTGFAVQGRAVPGPGLDQAVFAVVGKALQGATGAASFAEVAPVVVGKTQVLEGHEAVVLDLVELPIAAATEVAGRS